MVVSVCKQPRQIDHNFNRNVFVSIQFLTEESEAASKQVLAKSEQIRKFQEENKHLGQLVSLVRFQNCFQLRFIHNSIKFEENNVIKLLQRNSCYLSQSVVLPVFVFV